MNFEKLKDEMTDIIFRRITENSEPKYDQNGNLDDGRTMTDGNIVKTTKEIVTDIIQVVEDEQEKKKVVREILQDLKDMATIIPDFTLHLILNTLSQKYGVKI